TCVPFMHRRHTRRTPHGMELARDAKSAGGEHKLHQTEYAPLRRNPARAHRTSPRSSRCPQPPERPHGAPYRIAARPLVSQPPAMRRMVWATTLSVLALVSPLASSAVAGPNAGPAPVDTSPRAHGTEFDWPLSPEPTVTHGFDPPATVYGRGHRGADLAATSEQQVLAAAAGTVVYAGPLAGRGVISIQHRSGIRT